MITGPAGGRVASILLAVAVSIPATATAAPVAGKKNVGSDASEPLAPRHARFLEVVALLATTAEREAFFALGAAYRRDAFVEKFWRVRDPFPDTARNELRDTWNERVQIARAWFDDGLTGARGRLLLTAGEPAVRLEAHCRGVTWPLEAWQFEPGAHSPRPFAVVFLKSRGLARWRLWDRGSGIGVLFDDTSLAGNRRLITEIRAFLSQSRPSARMPVLTVAVPATCPLDDLIAALAAIAELGQLGPTAYEEAVARAEVAPAAPAEDWSGAFAAMTTKVPEGTPTLGASLTVDFLRQEGVRVLVGLRVDVEAAGLDPVPDAASATYVVGLVGEVLRDGALFDEFRYRFEVSAAGDSLVRVAAERRLRPGHYTLILRVDDLIGSAARRLEHALEVPALGAQPSSSLPPVFNTPGLGDGAGEAAEIELILPPGDVLTGYLRFEARVFGAVDRVAFELDGKPMMTRRSPPFAIEIDVGHLPRRRVLRAVAYDGDGTALAADERTINGGPHRFAVRIAEPLPEVRAGARGDIAMRVEVEVPTGRRLDRVELYRGDEQIVALHQPPFAHRIAAAGGIPVVLRALGILDDGSVAEDAIIVGGAKTASEVAVDLVEVYVAVTDRRDRPVTDLSVDSFRLLEDGVLITPRRFERVEDLPVHATVLLDTSASMAPRIEAARHAVVRFFGEAVRTEEDAVALVAFNDRPTLIAPYTSERGRFAAALAGLGASRSTALYDSLVYALYYQGGIPGQRTLLLVSDGDDEISRFSLEDALEYAQRAQVTIYTVGLDLGGDGARRILERIAAETGGRSFFVDDTADLDAVYRDVLGELRSRYLLVYQSPAAGEGFRRIDVAVEGRGLRARAMRGYHP